MGTRWAVRYQPRLARGGGPLLVQRSGKVFSMVFPPASATIETLLAAHLLPGRDEVRISHLDAAPHERVSTIDGEVEDLEELDALRGAQSVSIGDQPQSGRAVNGPPPEAGRVDLVVDWDAQASELPEVEDRATRSREVEVRSRAATGARAWSSCAHSGYGTSGTCPSMNISRSRPSISTPRGCGAPSNPAVCKNDRKRWIDSVCALEGRRTCSPLRVTAPTFATPPFNSSSATPQSVSPTTSSVGHFS
jgi:hypothetical protein